MMEMTKLDLILAPNSVLLKPCLPVGKITDKHRILIAQMFRIMKKYNGVGLSAPQVGRLLKILVMDTTRTKDGVRKAMINPEIIDTSVELQKNREGCLSFGSLTAITERPKKITVEYLDINGNKNIEDFDGLNAQCISHECDHLLGKLFINL